jgi:cytochrome c nitrite reductase small subunit
MSTRGRGWFLALLAAGIAVGVAAGLGGFTFGYARGGSYLTDDPQACANCHVMRDQYEGWLRSSHHAVAVCNDCHTPGSFVRKYWVKARNGWHHSVAFTLGGFHEPITIGSTNRLVTEERCRDCHAEVAAAVDALPGAVACIRCHDSVGHLSGE